MNSVSKQHMFMHMYIIMQAYVDRYYVLVYTYLCFSYTLNIQGDSDK